MTIFSKKQKEAVRLITALEEGFPERWFTQPELSGITLHTMIALVSKGVLERKNFIGLEYYKLCISKSDRKLCISESDKRKSKDTSK